ncbi:hypothetical protein BDZ90DRAFT_229053 [Jaminaea rosea]|uniref:Uncharacterized protein n=1 Tax=Jaminaea rosea TaxID=1569628 RepID=A0A316UXI3_9BASI|nr:hypothetical protein BDZ90DRAFT_229053 [Jaminaea rosea]PWN30016.1 hypothetical protein BDZ90DRAFT_229053 [Jaminaea rosea]
MPSADSPPTSSSAAVAGQQTSRSDPRLFNGRPLTDEERFPPPPKDLLSVLKTFMATQDRRVSLWKEYEEAMEGHLKAKQEQKERGVDLNEDEAAAPTTNGHHANGDHAPVSGEGHYATTTVPLSSDNLISRIVSLVTTGLLDCAHETRSLSLELRHNESFARPDLARMVDGVQEAENEVLRKVVKRDQVRRVLVTQGDEEARKVLAGPTNGQDEVGGPGEGNSVEEGIASLTAGIEELRKGRIAELLVEVRAEMTDLQAEAAEVGEE